MAPATQEQLVLASVADTSVWLKCKREDAGSGTMEGTGPSASWPFYSVDQPHSRLSYRCQSTAPVLGESTVVGHVTRKPSSSRTFRVVAAENCSALPASSFCPASTTPDHFPGSTPTSRATHEPLRAPNNLFTVPHHPHPIRREPHHFLYPDFPLPEPPKQASPDHHTTRPPDEQLAPQLPRHIGRPNQTHNSIPNICRDGYSTSQPTTHRPHDIHLDSQSGRASLASLTRPRPTTRPHSNKTDGIPPGHRIRPTYLSFPKIPSFCCQNDRQSRGQAPGDKLE